METVVHFFTFLLVLLVCAWIAVLAFAVLTVLKMAKYPHFIRDSDRTSFPLMKFPTQEFYDLVEHHVKAMEMPGVYVRRVTFSQGQLYYASREYLRVTRTGYSFDICAAPFGQSFFVSWWLGENIGLFESLLMAMPLIGKWATRYYESRTYYQLDTEAMFKGLVKYCVEQAINDMTSSKGNRLSKVSRTAPEVTRS